MNYKKNTPFKLKGSPFKQTLEPNYNEGKNPKMPPGGLIGDANLKETDLGNGVTAISSPPPEVETTSANGSVSLSDGSISHTNKMTTTSTNNQSSAGDILSGNLPSYDEAWSKNLEGIQGMYKNKEAYKADMNSIQKGDSRDLEREAERKKVQKASLLSGSGVSTTNTETFSNTNPLEAYQYGTKQGTYESRKNIRTTKQSSNTTKNKSISNARLDWKDTAKNKDGSKTIDGKKYDSRRDFMKSKKIAAKKEKNNSIMETSRSETKNSQRASDQNVAEGGKVRGNRVKITTANTQEEIQNAQNAANQANNATTSGLTIEDVNRARGSGFRYKKATPFKMNGYGSKNK